MSNDYQKNVDEMRSKLKYFRVPLRGKGAETVNIGDQSDFMLRASRQTGETSPMFKAEAKSPREATYKLTHIQDAGEPSIFGRFYTNENEYLSPKTVLSVLGSKMTTKFKYELSDRRRFRHNHIYDRDFIKDMEFDGYDRGDSDHVWFHMGLGLGESLVLNPLFQFHENDDVRTHARYTKLGRIYAETIYNDQTILAIMPGTVKYHTGLLKMIGLELGTTATTAKYIRSGGSGIGNFFRGIWMGAGDMLGVVGSIGAAVFGKAKMVEFVERPNLYATYINGLTQAMAVNLGLISATGAYAGTDRKLDYYSILPGAKLAEGKADWVKRFRSNRILNFRCGNDISVSESFSNSTTSNPVADAMNAESTEAEANARSGDTQKYADFLGTAFSSKDLGTAFMSLTKNFGHKLAAGFSQMSFIKSGGGKANFPDVYESSSFSRSYSFSFTFHSPYGVRESIFENTFMPMLFLLAMTLPRQVGSFSYIEPFALRAVVPGMLNINFGMIESLSIERGDSQNDWTPYNIPKTIKCSISIKDMDVNIALPLASKGYRETLFPSLFASSGISEYLVTLSGLSLAEQMDTGARGRRNWKKWVTGWRNRLDMDTIEAAFSDSGMGKLVEFFSGIVGNDDPAASGTHDFDAISDEYSKFGMQDPKYSRNLLGRFIAKLSIGVGDGTKVKTKYLKSAEWDSGDVDTDEGKNYADDEARY